MNYTTKIPILKSSTSVNFKIPDIYFKYVYSNDEINSCERWICGRKIVRRCKICNIWSNSKLQAHRHFLKHNKYTSYKFIDETEKLKKYFKRKNKLWTD